MSIEITSLVETGVLGVILAWFMFRLENLLKENTKALQVMQEQIIRLCNDIGTRKTQ